MTGIDARPRSATEIVDSAFHVLRQRYATFVRTAAIMYLPVIVLTLIGFGGTGFTGAPRLTSAAAATFILEMSWISVTNGVLAILTSQVFLGGEPDGATAIRTGLGRAIPIIIAGTATFVMSVIGFVFLFAPGIYAFTRFGSSTAVAAIEGTGPGTSLSRASELSRNNKIHYLGTMLIMLTLYLLVSGTVGVLVGLLGIPALSILVGAVVTVFLLPVVGTVQALLYYDLRIRNEGFDIELMSERLAPLPVAG